MPWESNQLNVVYFSMENIVIYAKKKNSDEEKSEINKLNRMFLWRIQWKVVHYINGKDGKMQPFE